MDIRTKLIFTLVAVALASMLALAGVVVPIVEDRLRAATLSELDELAESKREAMHWIADGWRERVDLVASRTQLRASLEEHDRTGGDAATTARIQTILEDALDASPRVSLYRVYDADGTVVASVTRGTRAALPTRALDPAGFSSEIAYEGVEFVGSGAPHVSFTSPLVRDGTLIGTLLVVFEAHELRELTGHYHGLGETGELLLFALDSTGSPRTLHPTRHGPPDEGVALATGEGSLAARAVADDHGPFFDDVEDYRGEAVWAATRRVPETGWGLILKVDDAEQRLPLAAFRQTVARTALILAAFAILAGFALGLRFAHPIHDLAEAANRVRKGELDARASVGGEDEVGLLARTFNEMAGELERKVTQLHEFRRFFDVSIDMMCMAGMDGFFKRVNPAFLNELGYTREELLAHPFSHFVHPDDVTKTEAELAKLREGIPTISFENRYRCSDGSYKRLRWTSYPEEETGLLFAIAHVMTSAEERAGRGSGSDSAADPAGA